MTFSDYIVYVDESGDHGLTSIDPDYPIFCLAFCIIHKQDYTETICPEIQRLKFKYWGHDFINLHAHDIRKEKGNFAVLRTNPTLREDFFKDLNALIQNSPMQIAASVIQKGELKDKYTNPYNPYEISLLFCMEKILEFLCKNGQEGRSINIVFEGRGPKEDQELELEFRRICDNKGSWGYKSVDFSKMSFEPQFVSKKENLPGLQVSDLIARPIGLRTLRPEQDNRAWDIIQDKIFAHKIFP